MIDVSVIIPWCEDNGAKERAILSVQKALEKVPGINGEIIPVDDRERSGVSSARNRGLEKAQGEWIAFVDSDDEMGGNFFEVMLASVKERPDIDLVTGGFVTDDTDLTKARGSLTEVMSGYSFMEKKLLDGDVHVWGKLFRRDKLGDIRFDESLTIGEDMLFLADFVLAMGKNRAAAAVDAPVYRYFINPEGAMERKFSESFLDELECWEKLSDRLKDAADKFSAYAFASLGAIRIRSAVMVAIKTYRLPEEERDSKLAVGARKAAGEIASASMEVPGAFAGLSLKEKFKAFMFVHFEGAFKRMLGKQ